MGKNEAVESIKKWREMILKIELTKENVVNIIRCLDYAQMYDSAVGLGIVKGFLFSEDNKKNFLDIVKKHNLSQEIIEMEKKNLSVLAANTPEDYLDNLLLSVKFKLEGKDEQLTNKHKEDFYKIMKTVGEINIEAINKFLDNQVQLKKVCV